MENIKLTWVIAHEPAYLFYRVAADFKRIVNEQSKDVMIDIEILTSDEYNKKYNPAQPATRHNLWKFLQDGTVHIAQMQTTSLARQFNKQMHVLDLPYIFKDHDHASSVLEGEIGNKLLNQFDTESNLKGLAYTYSGGFRLMPFDRSVTTLAEIEGMPVRSGMSGIARDTIEAFGFSAVPTEIEETSDVVKSGNAIGAEYVAQRLLPDNCGEWVKTIIDTQHSLFLTSIVVNVQWWNKLPSSVQEIFLYAAREAARNERVLSIEDGAKSIDILEKKGVKVVSLGNDDLDVLKEKVNTVYSKYSNGFFEDGLIDAVKNNKV